MKKVILQIFDENTGEVRFPELKRFLGMDIFGSSVLHYLKDKIPSLDKVIDVDDIVYVLKDFEQAFELLEFEGKNINNYKCVELYYNKKLEKYVVDVKKNDTDFHILYNYEKYYISPRLKKLETFKARLCQ